MSQEMWEDDDDDYDDDDDNREIHQRINQVNSQAGLPAVIDWDEIDKMTNAMADAMFGRVSSLDDNRDAQALARETIKHHRYYVESSKLVGETVITDHGGPQYDPANPATMNRCYGILAFDPRGLIPLSPQYDVKAVADRYLANHYDCDVLVAYQCEEELATETIAIHSGEFVCLYKACTACREWFNWDYKDRQAFRANEFFTDFFDRR